MAYGAVICVMHSINRLIFPSNSQIVIDSAYEQLELLRSALTKLDGEEQRGSNRKAINAVDAEIVAAVGKLEAVLDSYELDPYQLDQETIHSFLQTVEMLRLNYVRELSLTREEEEEEEEDEDEEEEDALPALLPIVDTTVGLSEQLKKVIIDDLQDWQCPPEFNKTIALVGMAGIGKTHLARQIYEHPTIVKEFNRRVWVRIGPKGDVKDALVEIVAQVERQPRNLYIEKTTDELKELLYQSVDCKVCLLVLDDVWSKSVCQEVLGFWPVKISACQLLVTTRIEEASGNPEDIHHMSFLNSEESWDLLWRNVFADQKLSVPPPQLEKFGKKIAEDCEGLPLLILTVANILRGLDKTQEYWKKVADNKTTTFTDAYDRIFKVLYVSYDYLPQHLRPCFLYMGVFPQRWKIPVTKLINLWGVEDLFESGVTDSTDFGLKCMDGIVSRSLSIVCKRSSTNIVKVSKLHSAYWHLCVKEARKNKFFHVLRNIADASCIESNRLSIQNNILFGIKEVYNAMAATRATRSLLCTGKYHEYPVPICSHDMMLLKVLDALSIRFYEFPTEVVRLSQLRYLALTHNGKLPYSISELQKVQCLIVQHHHNIIKLPKKKRDIVRGLRDSTCLPREIWDMWRLEQLWIMGRNLPEPSYNAELPNLVRLYMNAHSCTKDVFISTPRLKKLGIKIELQPVAAETSSCSCFDHIWLLRELESLKCVVANPLPCSQVPHNLSNLPRSLKKLSLNGFRFSQKHMSAIGWLPNLQVLKLRCSAFEGAKWEINQGEFRSLEILLIEDTDLKLITDVLHKLRHLRIRHCYKLNISSLISHFPNLETVEVVDCSPSLVNLAANLQYKKFYNRPSPQVVINSSWNIQ